jgi:hypothetical protein
VTASGRRFRLLLLLLVGLTGTGCGIEPQASPVAVDGAALPPEQVAAEEDDPVPAPDPTLVYLVNGDRLQPVPRSERDSVADALGALLEGPRDTETAFGLRSAIPAGTRLLGATVQGDEVQVDLSQEFTTIVGEEYLLALAQIVFTAVDAGPAGAVTIAIEGQQVPIAQADGQLSTGAVTPADYATLAPA